MKEGFVLKSLKQIFGNRSNGNGLHSSNNGNGIPHHVLHAHKRMLDFNSAIMEVEIIADNLKGNDNLLALKRLGEIKRELASARERRNFSGGLSDQEYDFIDKKLSSAEQIERVALKAFSEKEVVVEF